MGSSCRFEPTCSAYSCRRWKSVRGSGTYLTLARLVRCNPGATAGCDPVP